MHVDRQRLRKLIARPDRPAAPSEPEYERAAVFVLLADRKQTNLLLIRRAQRGDPWSGQIAFPGGHIDRGDAGTLQAAYRETHEEVGIEAGAITCLGELGHFQTNNTAVDLHVFVGVWDGAKPLRIDPVEVDQAIEVPLRSLVEEHERRGFRARSVEHLGETLVYPLGDTTIWGVTARIIHYLLELIGGSAGAAHPDPRG